MSIIVVSTTAWLYVQHCLVGDGKLLLRFAEVVQSNRKTI